MNERGVEGRAEASRRARSVAKGATWMLGLASWGVAGASGATFTVLNTNDSGSGSLRQAILDANAQPGADSIVFAIPGEPPHRVVPTRVLPFLFDTVSIDATTQPGYVDRPVVELDGRNAGVGGEGLHAAASDTWIRGLAVVGFGGNGVTLHASNCVVEACHLGIDTTGTNAVPNETGVMVFDMENNRLGSEELGSGNLISGNRGAGIFIHQNTATGTRIVGNRIGTDWTGTRPVGNGWVGIVSSGLRTQIGGTRPGEGNLISGNGDLDVGRGDGILLWMRDGDGGSCVIEGNWIGTDVTGTQRLGNIGYGIVIETPNNRIGGVHPAARNVVSGNSNGSGIHIGGFAGVRNATNNVVQGNYIGVDALGGHACRNGAWGISLATGNNRIGGTDPGAGNLISGNGFDGIALWDGTPAGNRIEGNTIGTDVSGTRSIPNGIHGVSIQRSSDTVVGGVLPTQRNLISGNASDGISISGAGSRSNRVVGNFVGTDITGSVAIRNGGFGISIDRGAADTLVGGHEPGAGNLISGNGRTGIDLRSGSTRTSVEGNRIGVDVSGTKPLGNGEQGLWIASDSNVVGGPVPGAGNLISGNRYCGIRIFGSQARHNVVSGNWIGTDVSGTHAITNGEAGVWIEGGISNRIGGRLAAERNVLSGNGWQGVLVDGSTPRFNEVVGNFVGTDPTGTAAIGNRYGGVSFGGWSNVLGGLAIEDRNLISGNGGDGVYVVSGASSNVVAGNFVGTSAGGDMALPNGRAGIWVDRSSAATPNRHLLVVGNLLSGNASSGFHAWSNVLSLRFVGNRIGTDGSGTRPIPNQGHGVVLSSASGASIGGPGPGEGNVVAYNAGIGVALVDRATNNAIRGNRIFGNGRQNLDLEGDGITDNDGLDNDVGSNQRQNFPVLTNVVIRGGELRVAGRIRTRAVGSYEIDVYASPAWATTSAAGFRYLGAVSVTPDGTGRAEFEAMFPADIPAGQRVTATATDTAGNTSEFCHPLPVTEDGGLRLLAGPVSVDVVAGESATFRALAEGRGPVVYQWFRDGIEIVGATEARLVMTPGANEPDARLHVRASDAEGAVESPVATLRVVPGWTHWAESEGGNGHFYRLTQWPCEAPIAESEALLHGGHLATVDSSAEQSFLNRAFLTGTMAGSPLWIGLSDARIEGRWEWRGGATATYRHWSPGEPQGGESEDYVAMNWGVAEGRNDPPGSWHDVPTAGTSLNNDRTDGPYYGIMETAEDPVQAPTLAVHPVGAHVVAGSDLRLTVEAAGEGPFAYQWRWNGAVLTNQVGPELVLTNMAGRDAGLYSVVVRNAKAATVSRLAEVNVWSKWETNGHYYGLTPPRGNWPRSEEVAMANGGHLVTVNAADEQTWLVEQFVRPPALRRAFWIGMTDRQDEGVWSWVGGEPVTYTGWDTGEPNNFGGNEDYSLMNFIRARDGGGREGGWADEKLAADTVTATLRARGPYQGIMETTVRPPLALEFVRSPESRDALAGQDVEFRVEAQGPGSLNYQWQRNGTNLVGEVGPVLSRSAVRGTDAGDYRVVVAAGAVTLPSRAARLQVLEPPTISVQPVSVSTNAGARILLSVETAGEGDIVYRWFRGGVPLEPSERFSGVTDATLAIDPASLADSGEYRVRVGNAAGVVDSMLAIVAVFVDPPRIVGEPADVSASEGEPVRLEVDAIGAVLNYRWQRDGVDVPGANGKALDIPRLDDSLAGGYAVVVGNDGGMVTSRVARVTVKRCVALPPSMFAWWTGEDHGTDVVRGRVARPAGGATYGGGRVGKAFRFDGLDSRLEVAHDPAFFPGTNSMAVTAWIRTTNAVGYGPVFSEYEAGGEGGEGESLFAFAVREGRLEGRIRDTDAGGPDAGSDQRITGTAGVADGEWHHVVFQREVEAGRLSLWVDGRLDAEEALHPAMRGPIQDDDGAADPWLIGAEYAFRSTTFAGVFLGEIDEVMVAKRALAEAEISAVHGAGGAGACPPPIVIVEGPRSRRVALGSRVELEVVARGVLPLTYRWRLNGQEIDGATNAVWVLPSVVVADGGAYTVSISDGDEVEESVSAIVEVELEALALVDRFGDRQVFVASAGIGRTDNLAATGETTAGEPRHAGKRGGRSLWMTWRPGQTGVATFRTAGSSFDTLLAVYQGEALGDLAEVASDEDSGGYLTSVVRFNAVAGQNYQIAVDGFAGASGTVVLGWSQEVEAPVLPRIVLQPAERLGTLGDPMALTVVATPAAVTYQWFRNGVSMLGRTAPTLVFDVVRPTDAGTYKVRVRGPNGATVDSDDAVVDVVDRSVGPASLSADKFEDLFSEEELRGGGALAGLHALGGGTVATVGTGLGGSQWTDTRRSSRSLGDPRVCDEATTATRWFRLRFELPAGNTKALELNSEGSEIPAMIAVFTNRAALTLVGCDVAVPPTNVAKVSWAPQRGVDYLVLVDGVRGARGRIQLNRVLEPEPNPLKPTEYGLRAGRMVIRMFPLPGTYDWQTGPGLEAMETMFRTNLTVGEFRFDDFEPAVAPSRIYRLKPVGAAAQPPGHR